MPYITNGKRDYKREYAMILLRRKNNKEYDAKYKKDAAARSVRSWHKNKTPEKLAVKRFYMKEYTLKYPERRKLSRKKTYQKHKEIDENIKLINRKNSSNIKNSIKITLFPIKFRIFCINYIIYSIIVILIFI